MNYNTSSTENIPVDNFDNLSPPEWVTEQNYSTPGEETPVNGTASDFSKIHPRFKQFDNWVVAGKRTVCNEVATTTTVSGEVKPDKTPYDPKTFKPYNPVFTSRAKADDKKTWSNYDCAIDVFKSGYFNFIGFEMRETPFVGIDIDQTQCLKKCAEIKDLKERQEKEAEIEGTTAALVKEARNAGVYVETTQSGGYHIIFTGQIPSSAARRKSILTYGKDEKATKKSAKQPLFEVYDGQDGRYYIMTGRDATGDPTICLQEFLERFLNKYFTIEEAEVKPVNNHRQPVNNHRLNSTEGLSDSEKAREALKFIDPDSFYEDWLNIGFALRSLPDGLQIWDDWSRGGGKYKTGECQRKWSNSSFHKSNAIGLGTLFQLAKENGYSPPKLSSKPSKNNSSNNALNRELEGLNDVQDWIEQLQEYKNGKLLTVLANAATILENDPNWQGVFRYNEFSQRIEKVKKPPYKNSKVGNWCNADSINTVIWLSREAKYGNFNPKTINEAVISVSLSQSFHPIKDYLNQLTWDKTPRIDDFFSDYFGTEKNDYTSQVSKVLFLSAVARIFKPGCKSDYVPILEGGQGIGKSSAVRALMPDPKYFSDTPFDMGAKDSYLAIVGKWIVELAELDSMNKADADRAKAFFSSSVDTYRKPYGEFIEDVPRETIFIGTVNKDAYLKDETGNRRYLPITCKTVDIKGIVECRDQLWAEAVSRFNQGEPWWPDSSLADEMKEQQEARYDQDVWQSTIGEYLRMHNEVTIEDVATSHQCLGLELNKIDKRTEMRIGKIIKYLGYSKHRARVNGILKYIYRQD
jgi:predicted P-loop ATPase